MVALVFLSSKAERDAIGRVLEQAQFQVDTVNDTKAALAAIDRAQPEVMIVGFYPGCHNLIRHARSLRGPRRTYIIVAFEKEPASEIPLVIAAGADDFCWRPIAREELLARAQNPQRIGRWSAALAKGDVTNGAPSVEIRRLRGLRCMGPIAGELLSQMMGAVDITEGWPASLRDASCGAAVPMSLVAEQCEIRIGVVLDEASAKAFAALVLGDPDPSENVLRDITRELASTAGAAVKRACLEERVELTTGLPVDEVIGAASDDGAARWTVTSQDSTIRVGLVCKVHRRENIRLPAEKVREGMVIVHDIRNDAGALLVRAGTRLTMTSAECVARTLGPMLVEVGNAA